MWDAYTISYWYYPEIVLLGAWQINYTYFKCIIVPQDPQTYLIVKSAKIRTACVHACICGCACVYNYKPKYM